LARILAAVIEIAAVGGLGMMAYLQRQSALRMVERIRTRELHRGQAERKLLEANLSMMPSQIDPRAPLQQLVLIRDDYAAAHSAAETRLNALIQDLRTRVAQSVVLTRPPGLQP
jgi:hypothetical protein